MWNGFADIGYSRNSRLQSLSQAQLATCVYPGQSNPGGLPPCPGIDANIYSYGFAGVGLHRAFGREFHGYASYQFNELSFDQLVLWWAYGMQPDFEPECGDDWIGLDPPADPD